MTYKAIVQALFQRSGMSVKDYAEAVGYSTPQVSNVINDKEPGSWKLVLACLRQANIELEACLELPEKVAEEEDERKLLRLYRELSAGRKALVLGSAVEFARVERLLGRHKMPK